MVITTHTAHLTSVTIHSPVWTTLYSSPWVQYCRHSTQNQRFAPWGVSHSYIGTVGVFRTHYADTIALVCVAWPDTLIAIGLFYKYGLTNMKAWVSLYSRIKLWNVITHPCPNPNDDATEPPLELVLEWIITSHCFLTILQQIHTPNLDADLINP